MTNARITRLLAVGAAAAVLATGCGMADTVRQAAPVAAPTAEEKLLDSLPDAGSGPFRFAVEGGDMPATGVLDAGRHAYRIDVSETDAELGFTMTMNVLVVRDRSWVKIRFRDTEKLAGLPKLPKKWMLVDPAKVEPDGLPVGYDQETDPGEAGVVVRAATDVRETAPGRFAGTTDLTLQGDAGIVDATTLTALGKKAGAVPFEAQTDGQGRLSRLVVRIPAAGKAKAATYEVTYRDYGTTPALAEPAQQQKAPAVVYEMLRG
jgi:hypothetical protein